jgi:hypothetical protein
MENAEEAQRFLAGYGWQASPEPHFDKRVVHPLAVVTDVSCDCFPSLYLPSIRLGSVLVDLINQAMGSVLSSSACPPAKKLRKSDIQLLPGKLL